MDLKRVKAGVVVLTCSKRTKHTELLRLCARIGYSPPSSL